VDQKKKTKLGHLNRRILKKKPKKVKPSNKKLCVPKTPNLRTKDRVRAVEVAPNAETVDKVAPPQPFKARPAPTSTRAPPLPCPTQPKKLCLPQTPNLESLRRHKQCVEESEKNALVRREEERKQRLFKAKPIPNYSKLGRLGVTNHPPPTLCEPKSPDLVSVDRHRQAKKVFQENVKRQMDLEKSQMNFIAKEYREPKVFVAKKTSTAPTVPVKSPQASKIQAAKREVAELRRQQQHDAEEKERKARMRKQAKEDLEALKEYRKTLVHKARPIKCDFEQPSLVTMPSKAELTMPKSPNLRTRMRKRK